MIYLLDTHLVLWAAGKPHLLSVAARRHLDDKSSGFMFSAAVIWEVAVKTARGRADFVADARLLRRNLIENGFAELNITSEHGAAVAGLPSIHKDPFDRIQVAQARVEGLVLLTADTVVAAYGSPVELV